MKNEEYTIQELAEATGLSRRTIHFYTQQGVLPPAAGAGLGARYGEEHLLRLKLVPLLRRQGLKLDAIRERFAGMSLEEMRRMLSDPGSSGGVKPPSVRPMPVAPAGQQHTHYRLPAGVSIVVPAGLRPADRRKVNSLLEAAGRIFGPGRPTIMRQELDGRSI